MLTPSQRQSLHDLMRAVLATDVATTDQRELATFIAGRTRATDLDAILEGVYGDVGVKAA